MLLQWGNGTAWHTFTDKALTCPRNIQHAAPTPWGTLTLTQSSQTPVRTFQGLFSAAAQNLGGENNYASRLNSIIHFLRCLESHKSLIKFSLIELEFIYWQFDDHAVSDHLQYTLLTKPLGYLTLKLNLQEKAKKKNLLSEIILWN